MFVDHYSIIETCVLDHLIFNIYIYIFNHYLIIGQRCCQSLVLLMVPRWDAFMSNRCKVKSFYEAWVAHTRSTNPHCPVLHNTLCWLERLQVAGLKLNHEVDHLELWKDPKQFFLDMLKRDGQLAYIYVHVLVAFLDFLSDFLRCRED